MTVVDSIVGIAAVAELLIVLAGLGELSTSVHRLRASIRSLLEHIAIRLATLILVAASVSIVVAIPFLGAALIALAARLIHPIPLH